MNRRSILALIGLAPIAGAAAALPKADNPAKLASGGVIRKTTGMALVGEKQNDFADSGIFRSEMVATAEGSTSTISIRADQLHIQNGPMNLSNSKIGPTTYCFKAERFDIAPVDEHGYIRLTEIK